MGEPSSDELGVRVSHNLTQNPNDIDISLILQILLRLAINLINGGNLTLEALLQEQLKKYNIEAPVEWNTEKPTRKGSQWFIGKHWTLGEKSFYEATFGDFKTNLKESWSSSANNTALTPEEKAEAKRRVDELIEAERIERERNFHDVSDTCTKEFETFSSSGDTPYLRRKQIAGELYGAKLKQNENGDPIVVVPLRDAEGKLWNYQRIYSQKLSAGDKFFAEGGRIEGCFHILQKELQPLPPPQVIYLCEGYATALSVKLALGDAAFVVAAFNANNLTPVATSLKSKYNVAKFIICADNDAYTVINNKQINVGLEKGRRAAGSVGGEIRYPVFKYPQKGLTDFNDLHTAEGIDTVRDVIENFSKYVQGIQPMCLPATRSGKPILPSEKEVSDYMLKEFNGRLVKQDRAVFFYKGTHWEELGPDGTDKLKQWIGVAANGMLGSRDLESYYRYLLIHTPSVPKGTNMFQPSPYAANFQDGTLHLRKGSGGLFSLVFEKHDKNDFLTSTLPFKYPGDVTKEKLPPAPKFEAVIQKLWANNADREECLRFAYQTIGASIMPAFPLIVFFWGKPNSGKSTWIKLLVKLIGFENVSSVQPADFFGFNMESMVGKLVNYDTDIDVNRPMNDSEVKKLIDRTPRRIKRKNRTDAYTYLPSVHLFAANSLPRSLDGSSHAYGRRLIVVHTDSFKAGTDRVMDFEEVLLQDEIEGIVARGVLGLKDLVELNGNFTIPEGSKDSVKKIENQSDVLGQFLEDVDNGEVKDENNTILVDEKAEMIRSNLWNVFSAWQEDSLTHNQKIGKHEFYRQMERRGYEAKRSAKNWFVKGVGVIALDGGVS